jgi:hypothetical protein
MSHMSCINFIVMAVLPQLSHLSCLVPNALSFCHVLAILSSLSCPACTILTFSGCPGCPVLVVLPRLFCPSCPATAFLSPAVFPRCPLFVVMFSLPCPICLVLHILSSEIFVIFVNFRMKIFVKIRKRKFSFQLYLRLQLRQVNWRPYVLKYIKFCSKPLAPRKKKFAIGLKIVTTIFFHHAYNMFLAIFFHVSRCEITPYNANLIF